jgi:hypothetical protein
LKQASCVSDSERELGKEEERERKAAVGYLFDGPVEVFERLDEVVLDERAER